MLFSKIPSVSWNNVDASLPIIDVREPYEFAQGHVPGAKNIPLSRISSYNNKQQVYVVCASGSRSKRAVSYLRKHGVDAINIRGGMALYGR